MQTAFLDEIQKKHFAQEFRFARSKVVTDSEAFSEIVFVIERIGRYLTPKVDNLGKFKNSIRALIDPDSISDFDRLYELVRNGRNDAFHTGAAARKLGQQAIKLALIVEAALFRGMCMKICDVMSSSPLCARPWQLLGEIRRNMLANQFSALPLESHDEKGRWPLVLDAELAKYIFSLSEDDRKSALRQNLSQALASKLAATFATTCTPDDAVAAVALRCNGLPVVVVDLRNSIVGFVTPFDFL